MSQRVKRVSIIVVLITLFASLGWVTTAWSRSSLMNEYPSATIAITFYLQGTSNWCGPDALQSEIQYVNQYNDGSPVSTVVPIIPKATLWAYMRDNTCKDISSGRDNALPGTVGDGNTDVRKMNIAYDFGVDPHAMAWTMYTHMGLNHFYHYWIYYSDVYQATSHLLGTLERYHEPVIVAAWYGSHWIVITGYKSVAPAYPGSPNTIYQLRIADPETGIKDWYNYNSGSGFLWTTYWFTPYTNTSDPDPATGWYVPPPAHWYNHFVTIERDPHGEKNPDFGMSIQGFISPNLRNFLPALRKAQPN
jgi:hypothetical protein